MKKLWITLTTILVLSFLIAGCGNTPSAANSSPVFSPTPSSPLTTSPLSTSTTAISPTASASALPSASALSPTSTISKYGGTFKFIDPRAPSTTIGWFAEAGASAGLWTPPVLEPFIECDVNGAFSPLLATKWEVASDLKSITLSLRKGVKFQDGSDFNASVAKWNLDQGIAAKVSLNYTLMTSVDIIDDYTIWINLSRYQNTILNTLASSYVISKAAFDAKGKEGLRWNPVGTGPFKFVSFNRDVSIKYTKFSDYWQDGKPFLDGVEEYFVADPLTASAAFQSGTFDATGGDLNSIFYNLQQKGFNVLKAYSGAFCLVPDSKNPDSPWSNIKVRQALDYAIDRDAIVKAGGFGFWTTTYQFAVPGTPSYNNSLESRSYNPAKAKQLLTEAGYPNGFKTSIFADVASTDKDAITAVQAYLSNVGINASLSMLDFASFSNYRSTGWKNGLLSGMVGFDANLNSSIDRYFAQTSTLFPSMVKSDDLQKLYLQSLAATNVDPLLIQKVVQYMYDNALFAALWAGTRGDVVKPTLQDSGMYTMQSWTGWKPYNAWFSK